MYRDISDFYSPKQLLGKGGSSKVLFIPKNTLKGLFSSIEIKFKLGVCCKMYR